MNPLPRRHNRLRHVRVLGPLVGAGVVLALSSCTPSDGSTAKAESPASTVGVSPLPAPTPSPATAAPTTTTTTSSTTTTTTTTEPATTEPATTEATTTTDSTTTTTTTTLPPNVEPVEPFGEQLQAVGTRSGEATSRIQWRLMQLGFWSSGADGRYGLTTKQAVMAFQKYIGLPATGSVDAVTAEYLTNMGERGHGLTDTGDVVEIDKTRQLLFIVKGGKTVWILNTSTGNGQPYEEEDKNSPGEIQKGVAITPNGLWKVNRERPEGWWEGDLGEIYRPKYFRGGIAVHGSNSVPNHPASHGCVRVTVEAMDFIWDNDLIPMGTTVWVHGG